MGFYGGEKIVKNGIFEIYPVNIETTENHYLSPFYSLVNQLFRLGHLQELSDCLPGGKPHIQKETLWFGAQYGPVQESRSYLDQLW